MYANDFMDMCEYAQGAAAREAASQITIKRLEARVGQLQIHLDQIQSTPVAVSIIDGVANVFPDILVRRGFEGGIMAAEAVARVIQTSVPLRSFFLVHRPRVVEKLVMHNVCSVSQANAFYNGLSRAAIVVDVGGVKTSETIDNKLQDMVLFHVRIPSTFRVFVSPDHVETLAPVLSNLSSELISKIVVLSRPGLSTRGFPFAPAMSLFYPDARFQTRPRLEIDTGIANQAALSSTSLTSPTVSVASRSSAAKKFVDPSLPLHKQNPPPCNEFYLMKCGKKPCKYSHEYLLSPEEHNTLEANAKKAPCHYLKNGQECPNEDCCWGHKCPQGKLCFHLAKAKCWFKGADMHSEPGVAAL